MLLMRYFIVKPALEFPDVGLLLPLSHLQFFGFVLSTLFLAASGYIINDYFDLKIDRINKPQKMILGRSISRKRAIIWHWILTILGLAIAFHLCYDLNLWSLFYVFVFVSGALWFYSTSIKHIPLLGNLLISILVGLVPLMISFTELSLVNIQQSTLLIDSGYRLNDTAYLLLGFSFFSFWVNLIREITKDVIDIKGDSASKISTLPNITSLKNTKLILIALHIVASFMLTYVILYILNDTISRYYIILCIILPLLVSVYLTAIGKAKKDFEIISLLLKSILFSGLMYAFVFYVNIT